MEAGGSDQQFGEGGAKMVNDGGDAETSVGPGDVSSFNE